MTLSIDTLRVGHIYRMINYGEKTEFELVAIENKDDYIIRDIASREIFNMKDLTKYGTGNDFNLEEIDEHS